jgi:hypothetical protein
MSSSSQEAKECEFDENLAGQAFVLALNYLGKRLGWSNNKIINVLNLNPEVFNKWIQDGTVAIQYPKIQPDIQAALHLLAIHKSLELMFNNPELQNSWLSTMHPVLKVIPEELMTKSIEGLICIRQYLDYVRERGA